MADLLYFFLLSTAWAAFLIGSAALVAFIQTLIYKRRNRKP